MKRLTLGVPPKLRRDVLRGRHKELGCVVDLLETAASDRGTILMVVGASGTGKTQLLEAAESIAAHDGFAVASTRPDELWQLHPLAPFLATLGYEPSADVDPWDSSWTSLQSCLQHVVGQLENRATRRPTLIVFDDIHQADAISLAAIQLLATRLRKAPLAWLLARRTGRCQAMADWSFSELHQEVTQTVELGPLPRPAIEDVITDMLGARPQASLVTFAEGVSGNPRLLVELISGLSEDGNVAVEQGQARLLSRQIPRRVESLVQKRLGRLGPTARSLVELAACLNKPVTLHDLTELGSWRAEPEIRQALEDDLLLVVRNDVVSIPHSMVRHVVVEAIPPTVRTDMLRRVNEAGQAEIGAKAHPAKGHDRQLSPRHEAAADLVRARALRELTNLPEHVGATDELDRPVSRAGSGSFVQRSAGAREQYAQGWASLTEGERTVAQLVADGLTNRQVAGRIHLSTHTVSFHLRKIFRKLGVGSRVELARSSILFASSSVHRTADDRQSSVSGDNPRSSGPTLVRSGQGGANFLGPATAGRR